MKPAPCLTHIKDAEDCSFTRGVLQTKETKKKRPLLFSSVIANGLGCQYVVDHSDMLDPTASTHLCFPSHVISLGTSDLKIEYNHLLHKLGFDNHVSGFAEVDKLPYLI